MKFYILPNMISAIWLMAVISLCSASSLTVKEQLVDVKLQDILITGTSQSGAEDGLESDQLYDGDINTCFKGPGVPDSFVKINFNYASVQSARLLKSSNVLGVKVCMDEADCFACRQSDETEAAAGLWSCNDNVGNGLQIVGGGAIQICEVIIRGVDGMAEVIEDKFEAVEGIKGEDHAAEETKMATTLGEDISLLDARLVKLTNRAEALEAGVDDLEKMYKGETGKTLLDISDGQDSIIVADELISVKLVEQVGDIEVPKGDLGEDKIESVLDLVASLSNAKLAAENLKIRYDTIEERVDELSENLGGVKIVYYVTKEDKEAQALTEMIESRMKNTIEEIADNGWEDSRTQFAIGITKETLSVFNACSKLNVKANALEGQTVKLNEQLSGSSI